MVYGSSILELSEKGITVVHGSGVKKAMVPQFHHKQSPAPTQKYSPLSTKPLSSLETLEQNYGGNERES